MGGLATPELSEPTRLPLRGLLYLAVLTLTWGANWPFIKMAVEDMPVLVFRAGCALTVGHGKFVLIFIAGSQHSIMGHRPVLAPLKRLGAGFGCARAAL